MKLLIVESPSKSKTISKYLGDDFVVRASVGHVRDLPKSNKQAVDIEGGFIPHYVIDPKKVSVLEEINKEAKKSTEIILATDPDREGEAIAWHLAEILKDRQGTNIANKIKRITFHEITKDAVNEALQNPRDIDEHLREAQEARRVLDRLVGYDLSGLIWKKVRYGLSAGRVQSPALRIIVEREREIKNFKPEDYWVISGIWNTENKDTVSLTCIKEPKTQKEVDDIIEKAKNNKWSIKDIEENEQKRSPRAPFITSTLQQTASSRLGFSPSRTMGIAQKLYESGLITYMRTDSTNIGGQAIGAITNIINKEYGEKYVTVRKFTTKSKNAQEAHEAIRPTDFNKKSAGANDEQKKLYKLIWQRTVASQMSDALLKKTKIIANIASDGIPDFEANGSRITFDGWLKADPESRGEENELPKCKNSESLELVSIDALAKQTQPPTRYTEAGLIKELEKRGIGRPSTYASIIKTIEDRGYVEKENRSLRPTDTGEVVSTFLEQNFPQYISDTFTAEMEDKLDDIANGTRTYTKTLSEFYTPFSKEVRSKDKIDKITTLGQADPKFKCPKCGSSLDIKLGKNGKFLSCSKYPECDGALTIDGTEFKKDEPIGTDPVSGLPIFVLNGRFGPYVQLGVSVPKVKKTRKTSKKIIDKAIEQISGDVNTAKISTNNVSDKTVLSNKPKMASIPKTMDPSKVTIADALKYLSLPRTLGNHPQSGKPITASNGRFGPYIAHDGEFRSIKSPDDVYTIELARALEMLAIPKKPRGGRFAKKSV
jgi:DNA topoisomerase-1